LKEGSVRGATPANFHTVRLAKAWKSWSNPRAFALITGEALASEATSASFLTVEPVTAKTVPTQVVATRRNRKIGVLRRLKRRKSEKRRSHPKRKQLPTYCYIKSISKKQRNAFVLIRFVSGYYAKENA
jgi:hypothetical protein